MTACSAISNVAITYINPITNKAPSEGKVNMLYLLVTLKLGLIIIKLMIKKNNVGTKNKKILATVPG